MAKIKDILEVEKRRVTEEQCRTVYLFQEGTFYRAYEWSAWLCVRYIQQFKPTKRMFKNEDASLVFVGFPVTSLEKYTLEGAERTVGEDKSVSLVLPAALFAPAADPQGLATEYGNWKQSVPLTENSKKELEVAERGVAATGRPVRLTEVLQKILAYPIEQRSPMESMSFLAEMKQEIAEII